MGVKNHFFYNPLWRRRCISTIVKGHIFGLLASSELSKGDSRPFRIDVVSTFDVVGGAATITIVFYDFEVKSPLPYVYVGHRLNRLFD